MSPRSSRSVISDRSSASSRVEPVYYEVVPELIEVNLFEQIKRLIIKELNDKKNRELSEFLHEMRGRFEDSEDFEIDDDSDDSLD